MPAWCSNVTGDGVVVSIVDDGESALSLHTRRHRFLFSIKRATIILTFQSKIMMNADKTLFLPGYLILQTSDIVTRVSFPPLSPGISVQSV